MEKQLHTVLGASGATGRAVVQELQKRKLSIRAVERTTKINGIDTVEADLLNKNEAIKAIQDSSFVYLCVGLPYRSDIWLKNWPLIIKNVIDACVATNAKLIFFDNIYMYGPPPLTIPFDENHLQHPTTKKGIARKQTADLLLEVMKDKKIDAVIGRSADFYGPFAVNSLFYISFLERMLQKKVPQVIATSGVKHTYAYAVDNGKALVLLALEPAANGQVYHLPVGEPKTIEEIASIFNKELGTTFNVSFLPPFMRKILSLFIPVLKEAGEMLYQFNNEYIMSFDKFKKQFPEFKVTSYEEGIKEMVRNFKDNTNTKK
ncbi:MAG: NAD-dependent epimerase/dehydratase family protein [Bacteroidota bacterium]|nr:NAD-dependent epimerase/dehydratase family protein [Bacteroidota bacterium]